jgi:hypothetical protein
MSERAEEKRRVARAAREEMWYGDVEGSFGQSFATSIPAQLRFVDDVQQSTGRFHDLLEDYGMPHSEPDPARKATSDHPHYRGEIIFEDEHTRMDVRVFGTGVVRIYPHDDYIPTEDQLVKLLKALEGGFGSKLKHDPIEREAPA